MTSFPLRSWVEIEAAALRHNLDAARRLSSGGALAAVVKGNAYGHGIDLVVQALEGEEIDFFAVANIAEAEAVRRNCEQLVNNRGISSQKAWGERILILGPALPDERSRIVEKGFTPILSSLEEARAYALLLAPGREPFAVHLAVDTGMGRIGIWHEEALAVAEAIHALPGMLLEGVATHLPAADEDRPGTLAELKLWRDFLHRLRWNGIVPRYAHAFNSAGTIGYSAGAATTGETADPEEAAGGANGNLVRPGLMLYGVSPIAEYQHLLRPVLTWKTRVTLVRDVPAGRSVSYGRTFVTPKPMRIATLGTGYADGYFRQLSGTGADVLIAGQRCPLLGRVTMDQMMVDVTHIPEGGAPGSEVVLLGRQGDEEISANALAEKARTIPWHVFTAITARVERRMR